MNMLRRRVALLIAVLALAGAPLAATAGPEVTVYKSPSCGCCSKWVEHLKSSGFSVTVRDVQNVEPLKQRLGVPRNLASCHTATVGGYVIEGHVPARDIQRLLAEKPRVKGLAVPGMPVGSPGMEQGSVRQPYDVVSFDERGATAVYGKY
jgi:hypothetical protein